MYPSRLLKGTAAVWWYTFLQSHEVSGKREDFKKAVVTEFVPEGHIRRARDCLRKPKQAKSISTYLSEFQNFILNVPDITDGEKREKFCAGLKPEIRLEVMKTTITGFQEASKIALRVDWPYGVHNTTHMPMVQPRHHFQVLVRQLVRLVCIHLWNSETSRVMLPGSGNRNVRRGIAITNVLFAIRWVAARGSISLVGRSMPTTLMSSPMWLVSFPWSTRVTRKTRWSFITN